MLRASLLLAVAAALSLASGASALCKEGKKACIKCDRKNGRCVECQHYRYTEEPFKLYPAYGLTKQGTCVKCQPQGKHPELCYTCDGNNPKRCTKCNDFEFGEPVYLKGDHTCDYCAEGCTACRDVTGHCTGCHEGYYLRKIGSGDGKAGRCERCSDKNCADCPRSPRQCRKCFMGSMFVKGKCTLCSRVIPRCNFCNNGKCENCESGYGAENGRCVKCKVPGCERCWNDASRCED